MALSPFLLTNAEQLLRFVSRFFNGFVPSISCETSFRPLNLDDATAHIRLPTPQT
jgi:hypothetical protein